MVLDTPALRTVDDKFPRVKERFVTLIRIGGGRVIQAYTATDKREMMGSLGPDDTVIALRTGQWHTDAFHVPSEILARWKRELLG